MSRRGAPTGAALAALAACWLVAERAPGAPAAGASAAPLPREEPVVYRRVPNITLSDVEGSTVQLSELWRRRPVIVTLVFERCFSICPFYLSSLKSAVAAVGGAGEDFDVLVVSFDPADTRESLQRLAERHRLRRQPGWIFALARPTEVRRLAESIGFWIEGGEDGAPFDHPAMLAAIDRGTVVRLLVGATVHERRLREVVWELNRQPVSTYPIPSPDVWFRCFDYDPEKGRVTFNWGLLLLLAPGVTMFLAAAAIFGSQRPPAGDSPHVPLRGGEAFQSAGSRAKLDRA